MVKDTNYMVMDMNRVAFSLRLNVFILGDVREKQVRKGMNWIT